LLAELSFGAPVEPLARHMPKSALQNLVSASACHKFSFAFASPISCVILLAIAALTGITRNYFANIVTKIADDAGKVSCSSSDIAAKTRQAILDGVNNNPTFISADALFKNYITAFGGVIIAFHIVVIQLFHCCSIFKRSKTAHICGIIFVSIGTILFLIAGTAIMYAAPSFRRAHSIMPCLTPDTGLLATPSIRRWRATQSLAILTLFPLPYAQTYPPSTPSSISQLSSAIHSFPPSPNGHQQYSRSSSHVSSPPAQVGGLIRGLGF
jgi:hypothetical protein